MSKQITRVSIRTADPRDADAIARVHVDSWQAAYAGLIPASVLNRLSVAGQTAGWRRLLGGGAAPGSCTWVLEAGDVILGFTSVGPTRDDDENPFTVGEIYTLYLTPTAWGRGLGGELFDAAQADLSRWGYTVATVWVLEGNTRARRFYELAGFERDSGRRLVRAGYASLPEIRYRREL